MTSTASTDHRNVARRRAPRILAGSLFVVVATLVQLPRQAGVHMWRTVWAEDGGQFYADALASPLREIALRSYAGYAHLVPRVLAAIGVHLPSEWYSAFVTLSSAFIAALLALFVYVASAPLLRSPTRQAVLSVALLLWPVLPFEVTGAICNIHWVMPMACLLAVLLPVEGRGAIAVRLPIVAFAPLSSPLCVLFVPIAVWQIVAAVRSERARRRTVVPFVYLGASLVQVLVWLTASKSPTEPKALGDFAVDLAKLYSTKVSTDLLFGVRVTEDLWEWGGYTLAAISTLAIGCAIAWRFVRAGAVARWFIAACALASPVVYAFSIWQRPSLVEGMLIDSRGAFNFIGMRYELFPAALLLLALLVPRDLSMDAFSGDAVHGADVRLPSESVLDDLRAQRVVVGVALVWFAVAFVPSYRLTTWRSAGPDWVAQVESAEQVCSADPTAAVPVLVTPAPVWSVTLPCSSLVEDGP